MYDIPKSLKSIPAYWLWHPSEFHNKELELSFLSVKKFAPWVSDFYVMSVVNPEIEGLKWIPINKVNGHTNDHIYQTLNNKIDILPDYYLYMNDDFYFVDNSSIEDFHFLYAFGENYSRRGNKGGSGFAKVLWDTLDFVREHDNCYVNFCSHCPFIMNKNHFIERTKCWPYQRGPQLETWLFASSNIEWRHASSIRSMWVYPPPNKNELYKSVYNSNRKLFAHSDDVFRDGNRFVFEFLEEVIL